MAPIDVDTYYRSPYGKILSSGGRTRVSPGRTATLEGKITTVQVTCNDQDDGGEMRIVGVAEGVKVGGFRGVGGFLGPKRVSAVGHSEKDRVNIRGRHGSEQIDITHDPYPSKKSSI